MAETEQDLAPDPEAYLPEPMADIQDTEPMGDGFASTFRGLVTPTAPHDWKETLSWATGQITNRDRDWAGLCQMFSRMAAGCPGGAASAFIQWSIMPADAKHVGGDPDDAPEGSMLFSIGENPHGHVMPAARPFRDDTGAAISTDALRVGWPDRVSRKGLYAKWRHRYLGWGQNMGGRYLDVREPKPEQVIRYPNLLEAHARLGNVLNDLRDARETAFSAGDHNDAKKIQDRIDLVKRARRQIWAMYENLRHA